MSDMNENCVFCSIVSGQSPAQIEYQDKDVIVFADIQPVAPIHFLIVPKKHIEKISQAEAVDDNLIGKLILTAKEIAHRRALDEDGYRLVINNGPNSGQLVDHLHVHLLAGASLGPMTSAKPNPISQFG